MSYLRPLILGACAAVAPAVAADPSASAPRPRLPASAATLLEAASPSRTLDAGTLHFVREPARDADDLPRIGIYTVAPGSAGGGDDAPSLCRLAARAGQLGLSPRRVIGCLGPARAGETYEVESIALRATDIQLRLRRDSPAHPADIPAAAAAPVYDYFSLQFPRDLPDGHYHVVCRVTTGDPALDPRPLTCAFDLFEPPAIDPLRAVTGDSLLKRFVAHATELHDDKERDLHNWPTDRGHIGSAGIFYEDPRYLRWRDECDEIVRRGAPMVPGLIDLLKREVPRNAAASEPEIEFGLSDRLMWMLCQIGDPRAVPLLVDVAAGFDGRANAVLRQTALDCAERLTFQTFLRRDNDYRPVLPHPTAVRIDPPPKRDQRRQLTIAMAGRCRDWLAGEGRDPAQWLPMARARARQMLDGDDLDDALRGAGFLAGDSVDDPSHDDDPARTMASAAAMIAAYERAPGTGAPPGKAAYLWRGRPATVAPTAWANLLARHGPRARAYAPLVIRTYRDAADPVPTMRSFVKLGGHDAAAYLIECMGILQGRLAAAGIARSAAWDDVIGDRDKNRQHSAYLQCRGAIERWAGRTFADDADIAPWWQANQNKDPQQWIDDGLAPTAAEADAGDPKAQYLIRQLLPDLPPVFGEVPWRPYHWEGDYRIKHIPPFRAAWLREHRPGLRYDPLAGNFRVITPQPR